ncbi:MAG: LacI family DNA-binding transcriptional regulator [Ancalomicrobiaceae bacterium]|nr:LacI family DNA-binding transcriptional regulator [Ancalomicrobiaceae bacterium]
MADVARVAGVSPMTVSRALRKHQFVSTKTMERIEHAVDQLGYVLDKSAGALSSRRTGFVAALVPSLNNSNFADTVRGITSGLTQSGRQVLLGYTDYSIENEEQLIEGMLRWRPEGIIVTGGRHTARARKLLQNAGIPVIETWDLPPNPIQNVVGFSNAEACRALVYRLYERGYRKIAFLGGTTTRDTRGADRRLGYQRAVDELGLPPGRVISFGSPPISMQQGGEAIVLLLRQWPDVDAVVCVSDLSAFGAIAECQRRGLDVPDRIAIAGFGDFEVARCSHPRITTVAVDAEAIGQLAAGQLIRALDSKDLNTPETLVVPFTVLERESTRKA